MRNVAKILKDEISRISRKEARSHVDPIGKSHAALKKVVTDLKKRIAVLEKENRRLMKPKGKDKTESAQKLTEGGGKVRFTSKSIRSLRSRLGLSQSDFAKLVGAAVQSVYLWENKEGVLSLRDKTRQALLSIRGLGAKEAKERLAGGETNK
jgi:DNA-binding transcriptional regulator YiaG